MASKKVLAIVAAIFVVVIVALLIMPGGDRDSEARYDYHLELADSFETSYGFTEKPGADEIYAILTICIANDSYDKGITTNPLTNVWQLDIGSILYDYSMDSYSYPGYELRTIAVGGTLTYHLVYEIPEGTTLEEIIVKHTWDIGAGPVFEFDDTLIPF